MLHRNQLAFQISNKGTCGIPHHPRLTNHKRSEWEWMEINCLQRWKRDILRRTVTNLCHVSSVLCHRDWGLWCHYFFVYIIKHCISSTSFQIFKERKAVLVSTFNNFFKKSHLLITIGDKCSYKKSECILFIIL